MLQKETLHFLTSLAAHNDKTWFGDHRKAYDAAKNDFHGLVDRLLPQLAVLDSRLGHLQVKDCVFRINRDVRFSTNKAPYKTNMGAGFSRHGKKDFGAGFYFHCEPGKSFVAGGAWMPEAPMLKRIRQEIDYNLPGFRSIVTSPDFTSRFGELSREEGYLSRPPRGYDDENEALPYLKYKSFVGTAVVPDKIICSKALVPYLMDHFSTLNPLIQFLDLAVEGV